MTEDQISERLDRLEQENRELHLALDVLRASLGAEVRTRRLVVETEDGFERIVVESGVDYGGVTVHARPRPGEGSTYFAIVGSEQCEPTNAAAFLMADGNVYGALQVFGPDNGEGPSCTLEIESPLQAPGVLIDSEGFKNAPMRLYARRRP